MPIQAAVAIPAAAAVGSAALSTAGGLFSNKTNKKIARETNALNYKMFQEANEYNLDMWNRTNQYNSPLNQRRLLEEAGYNPASLLDAPSLGSAQAAPGSVAPPQMQGWNYQNVLANVGNDLVAFTQAMKNAEEAKNVNLQNQNYEWRLTEEIDLMKRQGLLSEASANVLKQQYDLNEATWDDLMKTIHLNAYMTQEQAGIANMQHELLMSYGDAIKTAELDKLCAEAYKLTQEGKYEEAAKALIPAEISYKQAMVVIEKARQNQEAKESNSRIAQNQATTANIMTDTQRKKMENDVYSIFGKGQAAQTLLEAAARTENLVKDGRIKDAQGALAELEKYIKTWPANQKAAATGYWLRNLIPIFGIGDMFFK